MVFVLVAAISAVVYVATMYAAVNIGYALRELELTRVSLISEVREAEISLREQESRFLRIHELQLEAMERVTVVRKVVPLNVAFSQPQRYQY